MLKLPTWSSIEQHAKTAKDFQLVKLFEDDPARAETFRLRCAGLHLDFSKNLISEQTQKLFCALGEEAKILDSAQAMVTGELVNASESRAALHTLLRTPHGEQPKQLDSNASQVSDALKQMKSISGRLRDGDWRGHRDNKITDIVHIGIGGSYLGPSMVDEALTTEALPADTSNNIACHYVANVDGHHIHQTLASLNPDTTVIIVVSKSFTTMETMLNGKTAKKWLEDAMPASALQHHLIAITSNISGAESYGALAENILPMWDWVGGRYSVWSAVGLPIAIRYGFDKFNELLEGARQMDKHFLESDLSENMPFVLAWLGIWYQQFFSVTTHAVIPYDHGLRNFSEHLQQLDMESNGKRVTAMGEQVACDTAPVVWGGEGSNGQHAYHQLLHQGTRQVTVDFILPMQPRHPLTEHHDQLVASCLSQSQALMVGRSRQQMPNLEPKLAAQKEMPGNRPSNTIVVDKMSPYSLGALIALYEHKVFCQAMLWQINPFDQWGVELGKELGDNIFDAIKGDAIAGDAIELDGSTESLLRHYLALRAKR